MRADHFSAGMTDPYSHLDLGNPPEHNILRTYIYTLYAPTYLRFYKWQYNKRFIGKN